MPLRVARRPVVTAAPQPALAPARPDARGVRPVIADSFVRSAATLAPPPAPAAASRTIGPVQGALLGAVTVVGLMASLPLVVARSVGAGIRAAKEEGPRLLAPGGAYGLKAAAFAVGCSIVAFPHELIFQVAKIDARLRGEPLPQG